MIYTMQPHVVSKYSTVTEPRPYIIEVTSIIVTTMTFVTSPLYNYYNYNVNVNGIRIHSNVTGNVTLNFSTPGVYKIELSGIYPQINFNFPLAHYLSMNLKQWGTQIWRDSIPSPRLNGFDKYQIDAIDIPDLRLVNSLYYSLSNQNVNSSMNLTKWKTKHVTNMIGLATNTKVKTLNLAGWNTKKVNDMTAAFQGTIIETLNLSSWSTESVTNMTWMFRNSQIVTLDVAHFNVTNVTLMDYMFQGVSQTNIANISDWRPTSLTSANMFYYNAVNNAVNIIELDKIYSKWVNYLPTHSAGTHILDFGKVICSPSVLTFRTQIINKGWTVYDGRNPNPTQP